MVRKLLQIFFTIIFSFTYANAFEITGKVLDEQGLPDTNATVTLNGQQKVKVDIGGSYKLKGAKNGKNEVKAEKANHKYKDNPRKVTINNQNVSGVDFVRVTHTIFVNVKDSFGTPTAKAKITVVNGNKKKEAESNSNGIAKVVVPDGIWVVSVKKDLQIFEPASQPVNVIDSDVTIVFIKKSHNVTIQVVNDGAPVENALIRCVSDDVTRETTTNILGETVIKGVSGPCQFFAIKPFFRFGPTNPILLNVDRPGLKIKFFASPEGSNQTPTIDRIEIPSKGGTTVKFSVTASDKNLEQIKVKIDFADGTVETSGFKPTGSTFNFEHNYSVPFGQIKSFLTTITVIDPHGATASKQKNVFVSTK
jgi:hypothetical protein